MRRVLWRRVWLAWRDHSWRRHLTWRHHAGLGRWHHSWLHHAWGWWGHHHAWGRRGHHAWGWRHHTRLWRHHDWLWRWHHAWGRLVWLDDWLLSLNCLSLGGCCLCHLNLALMSLGSFGFRFLGFRLAAALPDANTDAQNDECWPTNPTANYKANSSLHCSYLSICGIPRAVVVDLVIRRL